MKQATFCVCGGGSIAHTLAAALGAKPRSRVHVLTRRPGDWSNAVHAIYRDELELIGNLERISSHPAEVVPDADVVLVTVPAYARGDILRRIGPHLRPETWLGAVPGNPGFDWQVRSVLGEHPRIFAVHRTPYICRTQLYGHLVAVAGVAPELFLAARPRGLTADVARLFQRAVHIPVTPVDNFLVVTLTPANSVVHASRLYTLFRDWRPSLEYEEIPWFYADWDDAASEALLACDAEIQHICSSLPLDLRRVVPVPEHYSVRDRSQLTQRIRSLPPLRSIQVPMVQGRRAYVPDLAHRFFLEDIPYGTVVVRAVAQIAGVPTPMLDEMITWAQGLFRREFLVDGAVRSSTSIGLPIPQNLGIETVDALVRAAT